MSEVSIELHRNTAGVLVSDSGIVIAPWLEAAFYAAKAREEQQRDIPETHLDYEQLLKNIGEMATATTVSS